MHSSEALPIGNLMPSVKDFLKRTAFAAMALLMFCSIPVSADASACVFEPKEIILPIDFHDNRDVHQRIDRIMDHAYPKLTPQKRVQYKKSILKWSERYSLCPVTIASIIWKESKFDEKCKYLGALGPMQTIPRYHRDRMAKAGISVGDICTIDKGVHIGCIVFRHYMDKSKGDVRKALKYYNGCVNAKNPKYVRDVIGMRDRSKHVKM